MKRFFYTDVLAAFWMAKHFGMIFEDTETSPEGKAYKVDFALLMEGNDLKSPISRYVVHADSLHLLEPQTDDTTLRSNGFTSLLCYETKYGALQANILPQMGFKGAVVKIIQRNGKAFHWPESEAA